MAEMAPGFRRVAALFRHEKALLAQFVASALLRAAAQMAMLIFIQRTLAALFDRNDRGVVARWVASLGAGQALTVAAVILVGTQIAGAAASYANGVAQHRMAKTVELGLTGQLVAHLLALGVPFVDQQSHGDIVQALRHDVTRVRLMVRALGQIVVEAIVFAFLLAGAVSLAPRLALWSLVAIPAAAAPVFWGARRALQGSYEARGASYAISDVILQILRGIRVIKACRAERATLERTMAEGNRYFEKLTRDLAVKAVGVVVMELLAGLVVVSIIVIGGHEVMMGRLAWPALLAFVMAVRAMYGPINNINTQWLTIASMGASMGRITELFGRAPAVADRDGAAPLGAPPARIAFERVSFAYGGEKVLHDVSFEVRAGETIGIVGPSGSGKTTLLTMLARFYDPTAGRVTLDGRDLRDVRLADLYGSLSIVTQETFVLSASVRENIALGRPGATDTEIASAARAAAVHEEIAALPEGYDTRIGMGGRELSGGQRQRIGVARALLADAPILLLDEATSSLDSVAEVAVQHAVSALMTGRTSFIVAHRLSTLRRADRILVLDGGRIAGFAPHAELYRECAVYRRLWDAQRLDELAAAAA